MKTCLLSLVLAASASPSAMAEERGFEIVLSGELAGKLPDDTRLFFWCTNDEREGRTCLMNDLPVVLPYDDFSGQYWHVEFTSREHGRLFSLCLSPDLFDRPRTINIKLDSPEPRLRLTGFPGMQAKYSAMITRRMEYYDLPNWDEKRQQFATPQPPILTIRRSTDGRLLRSRPMTEECMASKWWGTLRTLKLESGMTYQLSVSYDSGGLFPVMETKCDFTYDKEREGE